jgi:prevent-host-death family protein
MVWVSVEEIQRDLSTYLQRVEAGETLVIVQAGKPVAEVKPIVSRDPEHDVYVSVVSLWEAIVKHQLGKLSLPQPPEHYVPAQRVRHQLASLCLDEASVRHLASLPPIHRDPFDRMLICQAIEHGMTIITVDGLFDSYPVPVLNRA